MIYYDLAGYFTNWLACQMNLKYPFTSLFVMHDGQESLDSELSIVDLMRIGCEENGG